MSQRITKRIGRAYPDVFRGTKVSSRSRSVSYSKKAASSVRSKVAHARSIAGSALTQSKTGKRRH